MDILSWIIFGAIAGWIASMLVGKDDSGCFFNIIIGIVGSVVGGLLFQYFGGRGVTGFNLYSFMVAVVGAIVLLAVLNLARRK